MNDESHRIRDALLTLRCQLGEPAAFRELISEFERPLAYFVAKVIGDQDAAWDVLQLVWIRVLRQIGRLENPDHLRAWLFGMARGIAIDHLRKRDSIRRVEREYAEQFPEAEFEPGFDQEDTLEIHRALDQLDLELREVLTLFFIEDLSIAEVSRIVGCPEGTVKSRLYRARRELRDRLKGRNHD